MVDAIRASANAEPLGFTTTPLGASQLGVALPPTGDSTCSTPLCGRAAVALHRRERRRAVGRPRRARRAGARSARRSATSSTRRLAWHRSPPASPATSATPRSAAAAGSPTPPSSRGCADSPTPPAACRCRGQRPGHDGDPAERTRRRRHRRLRARRRRCRRRALRPQLSCTADVVAGRAGRARRGCCARRPRRRAHRAGWATPAGTTRRRRRPHCRAPRRCSPCGRCGRTPRDWRTTR